MNSPVTPGRSILVVHPEGNLSTNPNLSAFVSILADHGHSVSVLAPNRPFARSADQRVKAIIHSKLLDRVLAHLGNHTLTWATAMPFVGRALRPSPRPDVVIGIDRQGLLEAWGIARTTGAVLALMSYEIMFEAECGQAFKQVERQAARNVALAIAQDAERADCLAAETGIARDKIMLMPVGGTNGDAGPRPAERSGALVDRLGLPPTAKIALHAGSLENWTLMREVIAGLGDWPAPWVLVVNERQGARPSWLEEALVLHADRLFILPGGVETIDELGNILRCADLGLSLYRPDYTNIYTGRNLFHIGLASGKFSTYLQFGLPVVVTGGAEMARLVKSEGLGVAIADPLELPGFLADLDTSPMRVSCTNFFDRHLDARHYVPSILARIDTLTARLER